MIGASRELTAATHELSIAIGQAVRCLRALQSADVLDREAWLRGYCDAVQQIRAALDRGETIDAALDGCDAVIDRRLAELTGREKEVCGEK